MNEKSRSAFSRLQGFGVRAWPYLAILTVISGIVYFIFNQSLFHSFGCESVHIRQNYRASNAIFIDNQVIVIGTQDEVNNVIGTHDKLGNPTKVGSAGVSLNLVQNCDLSYLNSRKAPNTNLTEEQRKQLVLQLFEIPEDSDLTVENAVSQINAAHGLEPDTPVKYIFADPNYLTSLADLTFDACSLPNGTGSGGGGTPYGDPGVPDTEAKMRIARDAFIKQWAFVGSQGINLNLAPSSGFDGQEVRVGIFDTSPFRTPYPILRRIGIALPSPLWLTTRDAPGASLISNHGLFVAGLIHGIAPKSRVQLIPVLNEYGCGELWQIDRALQDYTSRMSAWTGYLDDTVINMSLGVNDKQHQPETPEEDQDEAEDEDPDENDRPTVDWEILSDRIFSLEKTVDEADRLGAVIVAAAGNDSYDTTEPAKEMRYPAKYQNVIGVAATNIDGNISCYSNKGDVAAPGGDGGEVTLKNPDGTTRTIPCGPRSNSWTDSPGPNGGPLCNANDPANCSFILVSLAQTDHGQQYIYWAGSSFAAPLVSGMAALAYEEMEKQQVICLIYGGASHATTPHSELGSGIINVGDSFTPTVMQKCPYP